jgi:hypothetical protein
VEELDIQKVDAELKLRAEARVLLEADGAQVAQIMRLNLQSSH